MRRIFLNTLYLAVLCASCSVERSDNGQLDGFWQLKTVDTLSTGGVADMRESQMTWAFQGGLVEFRHAPNRDKDYYMSFVHKGDSLLLFGAYHLLREQGDTLLQSATLLAPFGVTRLNQGFRILELGSQQMCLRSEDLKLTLRRY
jgi:hypothetical protein